MFLAARAPHAGSAPDPSSGELAEGEGGVRVQRAASPAAAEPTRRSSRGTLQVGTAQGPPNIRGPAPPEPQSTGPCRRLAAQQWT